MELDESGATLDFESFLSTRITRLGRALTRLHPRPHLVKAGLDSQEWRTIALIAAQAGSSAGELAARMSLDKAVFSRTLLRLRERGLVDVRADPADARRQSLWLTSEGEKVHAMILPHARRRQASFLLALSPADRVRLWHMLETLTEVVETRTSEEAAAASELRAQRRSRDRPPRS